MIRPSDYIAALIVDFYKLGHVGMIPDDVTEIYSNITCRSARLLGALPGYDNKALLIGQQRALDDLHTLWQDGFFQKPKGEVIAKIRRRLTRSLPSNVKVDEICHELEMLHDLRYLPVRIKTLPEGRRVSMKIPFLTVINTHKEFKFITNFLETVLSSELWKPIVIASRAFELRRLLSRRAIETTGSDAGVLLQAHDFSMRGMSGFIDASNSGIGHLSCFLGTDTVPAIDVVEHHYGIDENDPVGRSVAATEHMIMCLGQEKGEIELVRRLVEDDFGTGIISIVSDTWDFFRFITVYVAQLKNTILARSPDNSGIAKVVFRPDSGDPETILCGDRNAEPGTPEYKGAVQCLWEIFGGTTTEQGYKLLNSKVGLIYGDSITLQRAEAITARLMEMGFASVNIVFGIGSFTYQFITRDSLSEAMKATMANIDGQSISLLKNPKTDDGTKKSASGLLRVDEVDGEFVLKELCTPEEEAGGSLFIAYEDGEFFNRTKWQEVKSNVEMELNKVLKKEGITRG